MHVEQWYKIEQYDKRKSDSKTALFRHKCDTKNAISINQQKQNSATAD